MILPIKIYPDKILRKKSEKVKEITDAEKELIDNMFETMYRNNGIGLAAPQIGVLKRIIVVDIGNGPISLINPEILKKKGKAISTEGCLSVPGVILKVKRASYVKVKGLTKNGKQIVIKAKGLLAFALQHEIDHLNGILIYDRAGFLKRFETKVREFLKGIT